MPSALGQDFPWRKSRRRDDNAAADPVVVAGQRIRMSRLLLIDDDPELLMDQVNHLFGPRGMLINVARSGREGLEKIERQRPDVVLLDVNLPDLSGLAVYRRLRTVDARIPVIF